MNSPLSESELIKYREQIHQNRLAAWPRPWRCRLLRFALGRRTFEYMLRSIKADRRTPGARMVDIVVRQDGREERIEADWVKEIARMAYHLEAPKHRDTPVWLRSLRTKWWRLKCALRYPVSVHGTRETDAADNQAEKCRE